MSLFLTDLKKLPLPPTDPNFCTDDYDIENEKNFKNEISNLEKKYESRVTTMKRPT